jgi:hypothetical protein
VWKNLSDAFGPRFLRDFGSVAPPIWADGIRRLKDHEIARGFRKLAMRGNGSCPTFPQFFRACKEITSDEEGGAAPPERLALPAPPKGDFFSGLGNATLSRFMIRDDVPALDREQFERLETIKRRLVADYRATGDRSEASADEWRDVMLAAFADEMGVRHVPQRSAA